MPEQIKIVISGDSKSLIAELKKAGVEVKAFTKDSEGAGKGAKSFGSEAKGLAAELGLLYGLNQVVGMVKDFGVESYQAAAAAERLGRATDNMAKGIGESGQAMVDAITGASQGTISQLDAMTAANKAMMFGLVEDKQQMAELTQIAVTLGAAMGQGAGKSIDDLTTALGRQSPMILDNLGITLKLEEAHRIYAASLGKTAEELTDAEKKQAFVNAALEKGKEKVAELGGVTVDSAAKTEQLAAAWSDFQVAFGGLLTQMDGGVEILTGWVRQLEAGAGAWQGVIDKANLLAEAHARVAGETDEAANAQAAYLKEAQIPWEKLLEPLVRWSIVGTDSQEELAAAVQQVTKATEEGASAKADAAEKSRMMAQAASFEAAAVTQATEATADAAEKSRLMAQADTAATKATTDQIKNWSSLSETQQQQLVRMGELHELSATQVKALTEAQKEAVDAEEARIESLNSLLGSQADYYNSFAELQANAAANEQSYNASMSAARDEAAASIEDKSKDLTEKLTDIEQERAEKLAWVMDGAHARTAEQNAAALGYWNAHYDELKNKAVTKNQEITAEIQAEQAKRESNAAAARAKEQAEYQAHLDDLKLKTSLSLLETTGQLEQMTGLVGISATEAADLIKAGLLPVTQELGTAIQTTMGDLATKQGEAASQAETNQATLAQAYDGTLPAMQGQADMIGSILPQAMTTGQSAMGDFSKSVETEFDKAGKRIKDFGDAVKKEDWPSIGKAIDTGIVKGIKENEHLVLEKLKELARNALDSAETELGIHSPSTEFAQVAAMIVAGMTGELDRSGGLVESAINNLFDFRPDSVNEVIGAAADDVEKFLDNIGLTGKKGSLTLTALKNVFRGNADEILNATDRAAKFKELLDKTGINFERIFAGGTHSPFAGKGGGVLSVFLNQFDQRKKEAEAALVAAKLAAVGQGIGLAGQAGGFALSAGQQLKDQLETQLKFTQSKEEQLRIEQEITAIEQGMAQLQGGQDALKDLQQQKQRAEFARKYGLDVQSVLGMEDKQVQFLQQQMSLMDAMKKAGLGDLGFGPGAGLGGIFQGAGQTMLTLIDRLSALWGEVGPGPGFAGGTPPGGFMVPGPSGQPFPIMVHGGEQVNVTPAGQRGGDTYILNVTSSMPSAGIVRDFRMLQAAARG